MEKQGKGLIAVDGGATKTDLVLFQEDGTVIRRLIGGPSNSREFGCEQSVTTLDSLLRSRFPLNDFTDAIGSIHLGLAGGGITPNQIRYQQFLQDRFHGVHHLGNGSDAINALNAGLPSGDGMVLIAGTGSAVFVRAGDTRLQVGGWGHLLGDEGSGYDIGRMGLRQVLQELDGRLPATSLSPLLCQAIGRPVDEAIPDLYRGGKRLIASLAPLVFEAAANGDPAAREILRESARQLSLLIQAGSRHLSQPPYLVVLSGSLWQANDGLLENLVFAQLDESYRTIHPRLPPVYGSAVAAMNGAGYPVTEAFSRRFARTLLAASSARTIRPAKDRAGTSETRQKTV